MYSPPLDRTLRALEAAGIVIDPTVERVDPNALAAFLAGVAWSVDRWPEGLRDKGVEIRAKVFERDLRRTEDEIPGAAVEANVIYVNLAALGWGAIQGVEPSREFGLGVHEAVHVLHNQLTIPGLIVLIDPRRMGFGDNHLVMHPDAFRGAHGLIERALTKDALRGPGEMSPEAAREFATGRRNPQIEAYIEFFDDVFGRNPLRLAETRNLRISDGQIVHGSRAQAIAIGNERFALALASPIAASSAEHQDQVLYARTEDGTGVVTSGSKIVFVEPGQQPELVEIDKTQRVKMRLGVPAYVPLLSKSAEPITTDRIVDLLFVQRTDVGRYGERGRTIRMPVDYGDVPVAAGVSTLVEELDERMGQELRDALWLPIATTPQPRSASSEKETVLAGHSATRPILLL